MGSLCLLSLPSSIVVEKREPTLDRSWDNVYIAFPKVKALPGSFLDLFVHPSASYRRRNVILGGKDREPVHSAISVISS